MNQSVDCWYCGEVASTNDHVLPQSRYGRIGVQLPACRRCNSSKNARTPDEWLASLFGPGETPFAWSEIKGIAARCFSTGVASPEETARLCRINWGRKIRGIAQDLAVTHDEALIALADITGEYDGNVDEFLCVYEPENWDSRDFFVLIRTEGDR